MIHPFKRRRVDLHSPVEVYRNLHRNGYSVRQHGLVVGHAYSVMVVAATFVVNASAHRRSLREGRRNVHAWVKGLMVDSAMGTTPEKAHGMARVRYDREAGRFEARGRRALEAGAVALNPRGAYASYLYLENA